MGQHSTYEFEQDGLYQFMQEAIKGRVGLSTSLMDVVTVVSTLIVAAVFAAFASKESYIIVFVAASMLSLAGASIIAISRIPRFVQAEESTKPN